MHRHDRREKPSEKKKVNGKQQMWQSDDAIREQEWKLNRHGRRSWQQEKQLLRQIDPKELNEYLLDQE